MPEKENAGKDGKAQCHTSCTWKHVDLISERGETLQKNQWESSTEYVACQRF